MTKYDRIVGVLSAGKTLTPRQIAKRYGFANPSDAIYKLRNRGMTIKSKRVVLTNGRRTVRYSMAPTASI